MGPKKKKKGKIKKGGGDSGGPDLKNKMEIMSKEMAIKNIQSRLIMTYNYQ